MAAKPVQWPVQWGWLEHYLIKVIGLGMYDYAYGFPTRPIGLVQYVHVRSTGAAVLRILVHVPPFFTCRIRMTSPFCLGGGESVMWRIFLTC